MIPPASVGTSVSAPLDGIVVIDLTRVLSGPYCTMLLGDMGARVIKIEQPGRGDDTRAWGPPFLGEESAYFLSVNRNKESVTLNLKHPDGRRLLQELLARADVLVENFLPGTLDRLGFGYAAVAERLPRLVYCSISGFGQTGPRRDERGYDAVVQAESGLMSITGPEDTPYRLGVAIADIVAGMFAAQGVQLALLARERSGRGQRVDIGMLDAASALLTYQAAIYFATGTVPRRMGNRHPTIAPYETFETAEGDVVVAVGNDVQWRAFCHEAGLPELATDPRFNTNSGRVTGYAVLRPLIQDRLRTRPAADWIDRFTRAGIPCGSVRALDQALADPQLASRDMIEELDHPSVGRLRVLGVPIKLSETPGSLRRPPPTLGQDTERVLTRDLGLAADDIARLRADAVV